MSHHFTSYPKMLEQAHPIWYQKTNVESTDKGQFGRKKKSGMVKIKEMTNDRIRNPKWGKPGNGLPHIYPEEWW